MAGFASVGFAGGTGSRAGGGGGAVEWVDAFPSTQDAKVDTIYVRKSDLHARALVETTAATAASITTSLVSTTAWKGGGATLPSSGAAGDLFFETDAEHGTDPFAWRGLVRRYAVPALPASVDLSVSQYKGVHGAVPGGASAVGDFYWDTRIIVSGYPNGGMEQRRDSVNFGTMTLSQLRTAVGDTRAGWIARRTNGTVEFVTDGSVNPRPGLTRAQALAAMTADSGYDRRVWYYFDTADNMVEYIDAREPAYTHSSYKGVTTAVIDTTLLTGNNQWAFRSSYFADGYTGAGFGRGSGSTIRFMRVAELQSYTGSTLGWMGRRGSTGAVFFSNGGTSFDDELKGRFDSVAQAKAAFDAGGNGKQSNRDYLFYATDRNAVLNTATAFAPLTYPGWSTAPVGIAQFRTDIGVSAIGFLSNVSGAGFFLSRTGGPFDVCGGSFAGDAAVIAAIEAPHLDGYQSGTDYMYWDSGAGALKRLSAYTAGKAAVRRWENLQAVEFVDDFPTTANAQDSVLYVKNSDGTAKYKVRDLTTASSIATTNVSVGGGYRGSTALPPSTGVAGDWYWDRDNVHNGLTGGAFRYDLAFADPWRPATAAQLRTLTGDSDLGFIVSMNDGTVRFLNDGGAAFVGGGFANDAAVIAAIEASAGGYQATRAYYYYDTGANALKRIAAGGYAAPVYSTAMRDLAGASGGTGSNVPNKPATPTNTTKYELQITSSGAASWQTASAGTGSNVPNKPSNPTETTKYEMQITPAGTATWETAAAAGSDVPNKPANPSATTRYELQLTSAGAASWVAATGGTATGLRLRGAWATATVYAVGDIVYDGAAGENFYLCVLAHTSSSTLRPVDRIRINNAGEWIRINTTISNWSSGTRYPQGVVVKHSVSGSVQIFLAVGTVDGPTEITTEPQSSTNWVRIDGGGTGGTGSDVPNKPGTPSTTTKYELQITSAGVASWVTAAAAASGGNAFTPESFTASKTLTASDFGKLFYQSGVTTPTLTLPPIRAADVGKMIAFFNAGATGETLTVARNSSSQAFDGYPNEPASIVLGETHKSMVVVAVSTTFWAVIRPTGLPVVPNRPASTTKYELQMTSAGVASWVTAATGGGSTAVARWPVTDVSANTTIAATDVGKLFSVTGTTARTFNLPRITSSIQGLHFAIENSSTQAVTLSPDSNDSIDKGNAGSDYTLNSPEAVLVFAGTDNDWFTLRSGLPSARLGTDARKVLYGNGVWGNPVFVGDSAPTGNLYEGMLWVDTTGTQTVPKVYTGSSWQNIGTGQGGGVGVEDEGTLLTGTASRLDFVGAGVTASGTGGEKTITIPGAPSPTDTDLDTEFPAIESATVPPSRRAAAAATGDLRETALNNVIEWRAADGGGDPTINTFEQPARFAMGRPSNDINIADVEWAGNVWSNSTTVADSQVNVTGTTVRFNPSNADYGSVNSNITVGRIIRVMRGNAWFQGRVATKTGTTTFVLTTTQGVTFGNFATETGTVTVKRYNPKFDTSTGYLIAANADDLDANRNVVATVPDVPGLAPDNARMRMAFKYTQGQWGFYGFFAAKGSATNDAINIDASDEGQIDAGLLFFFVMSITGACRLDIKRGNGTTANARVGTDCDFFRGGAAMGTGAININQGFVSTIQRTGAGVRVNYRTGSNAPSLGYRTTDTEFVLDVLSNGNSYTFLLNGIELCEIRWRTGNYAFERNTTTGAYRFPARVGPYYGFQTNNAQPELQIALTQLVVGAASNRVEVLPDTIGADLLMLPSRNNNRILTLNASGALAAEFAAQRPTGSEIGNNSNLVRLWAPEDVNAAIGAHEGANQPADIRALTATDPKDDDIDIEVAAQSRTRTRNNRSITFTGSGNGPIMVSSLASSFGGIYEIQWSRANVGSVYVSALDGGTGYSSAPTVTVSGGSPTTPATATANISGGVVTSLTWDERGAGYSSAPTISFSGGSPTTPATATARLGTYSVEVQDYALHPNYTLYSIFVGANEFRLPLVATAGGGTRRTWSSGDVPGASDWPGSAGAHDINFRKTGPSGDFFWETVTNTDRFEKMDRAAMQEWAVDGADVSHKLDVYLEGTEWRRAGDIEQGGFGIVSALPMNGSEVGQLLSYVNPGSGSRRTWDQDAPVTGEDFNASANITGFSRVLPTDSGGMAGAIWNFDHRSGQYSLGRLAWCAMAAALPLDDWDGGNWENFYAYIRIEERGTTSANVGAYYRGFNTSGSSTAEDSTYWAEPIDYEDSGLSTYPIAAVTELICRDRLNKTRYFRLTSHSGPGGYTEILTDNRFTVVSAHDVDLRVWDGAQWRNESPDYSTKSQAEGGTDLSTVMNPARTKDAIAEFGIQRVLRATTNNLPTTATLFGNVFTGQNWTTAAGAPSGWEGQSGTVQRYNYPINPSWLRLGFEVVAEEGGTDVSRYFVPNYGATEGGGGRQMRTSGNFSFLFVLDASYFVLEGTGSAFANNTKVKIYEVYWP